MTSVFIRALQMKYSCAANSDIVNLLVFILKPVLDYLTQILNEVHLFLNLLLSVVITVTRTSMVQLHLLSWLEHGTGPTDPFLENNRLHLLNYVMMF